MGHGDEGADPGPVPPSGSPAAGADAELTIATLRSEMRPLRAELESHRVDAIRLASELREVRAQLARERGAPSGEPRTLVRRLRDRIAREPLPATPAEEEDLDLDYYRTRYHDLAGLDDDALRRHWMLFGRPEGRVGRRRSEPYTAPRRAPAERPAVLIATTGTPDAVDDVAAALASSLRSEFTVVLVTGTAPSTPEWVRPEDIEVSLSPEVFGDLYEAEQIITDVVDAHRPRFALLNGAGSKEFSIGLETSGVPTIALIHEFAEDLAVRGSLADLVGSASAIVFASRAAAASANREHAFLRGRALDIVGPPSSLTRRFAPPDADRDHDDFVVIGVGDVTPLSGIEFFLEIAAAIDPASGIRFVWVGDEPDESYADLVRARARQHPLPAVFSRRRVSEDGLLPAADAFVDTARRESFSPEAESAAEAGLPVLAFREATAFVDLLEDDDGLRMLALDYADSAAAAELLSRLASDRVASEEVGARVAAAAVLSTDSYARRIRGIADRVVAMRAVELEDAALVTASALITPGFYWGDNPFRPDDQAVIRHYVHRSALARPRARPLSGLVARRGLEGFHPLIWAEEHDDDERDPLVAWHEAGRPDGRWTHTVIRNGPGDTAVASVHPSIAVHVHLYYPDLILDLIPRLRRCAFSWDLMVTTDTTAKAETIERHCRDAGIDSVDVIVVPNRGRDIGPLITAIGFERLRGRDLLLHVHGKRSAHAGDGVGDTWRDFLWGSLISSADDRPAIGDAIVAAFERDDRLGIVFPEDPNLHSWDDNRDLAEATAVRAGIALPSHDHFEFPQGGTFWCRVAAIAPVLELGLGWDDYPDEPAPIDGTILHAIERMLALVPEAAGYGFATAAVDGVIR